jgi:hypothetical protein
MPAQHTASLAVNTDGNPVLTTTHPAMPYPIALPRVDFPDALSPDTQAYATALLQAANIIPASTALSWQRYGTTRVNALRTAHAVRALLPAPTPV